MPVATYRYQALKEALAAAVSAHGHPASGDVRRAQALAVVSGLAGNGYVASLLVSRCFRLGAADAARKVFDAVPGRLGLDRPAETPPLQRHAPRIAC